MVCVQVFVGIVDQCGQVCFDVQVDVFQVELLFEFVMFDFVFDLCYFVFDCGQVVGVDDFLCGEYVCVCE